MILSIESSCDDSSLALTRIEDARLLYHIKLSQDEAHSSYGGIVPEIASRLHAKRLPEILKSVKTFIHNDMSALKAIAVTTRPGLSVTLIEGLMMAEALALSLSIPLICVNHLKGHIYSLFIERAEDLESLESRGCLESKQDLESKELGGWQNIAQNIGRDCTRDSKVSKDFGGGLESCLDTHASLRAHLDSRRNSSAESKSDSKLPLPSPPPNPESTLPLAVLLVSGGHTQILQMSDFSHIRLVAQSLDDSFGESFDKVAKHLNLGYPGGPLIDRLAREFALAHPTALPHSFPVPLLHKSELCFSFSGLKNAVRLAIESAIHSTESATESARTDSQDSQKSALSAYEVGRICAGFQKSACEHITRKVRQYFMSEQAREARHFAIVGGASANSALRESLASLCAEFGKTLLLAPLEFCSDNAAMIGRVGVEQYKRGDFTPLHEAQIMPKSLPDDFIS